MILCTVDGDGQPHSRAVTLHIWDQHGFVFCSNYEGPKSTQLAANPKACLSFLWPNLEKQVRIEGVVEKVTKAETEFLFRKCSNTEQLFFNVLSEGKDHKFNQSNVCNREEFVVYMNEVYKQYRSKGGEKQEIKLPKAWGGFRLKPNYIEFFDGSALWVDRKVWKKTKRAPQKHPLDDKPQTPQQESEDEDAKLQTRNEPEDEDAKLQTQLQVQSKQDAENAEDQW
eukprot:CAMPEP_0174256372 /NCGR_PEP_ID=MMETSP0439-20130205/5616_1 /TAXON_ID=0 /ORGANISM="Stereomyxa ramosa, Strain Chinc5" /LENGTH=225 /DNA_ID=CAMNT_0015338951 /DNA_START=94 /DNA_END=768 /DNA_ORIENTATION=-